jgi:hypothetical protein
MTGLFLVQVKIIPVFEPKDRGSLIRTQELRIDTDIHKCIPAAVRINGIIPAVVKHIQGDTRKGIPFSGKLLDRLVGIMACNHRWNSVQIQQIILDL